METSAEMSTVHTAQIFAALRYRAYPSIQSVLKLFGLNRLKRESLAAGFVASSAFDRIVLFADGDDWSRVIRYVGSQDFDHAMKRLRALLVADNDNVREPALKHAFGRIRYADPQSLEPMR